MARAGRAGREEARQGLAEVLLLYVVLRFVVDAFGWPDGAKSGSRLTPHACARLPLPQDLYQNLMRIVAAFSALIGLFTVPFCALTALFSMPTTLRIGLLPARAAVRTGANTAVSLCAVTHCE